MVVAGLSLPGAASAGVHASVSAFAVGSGTTTPGRIAAGDFNGDGVVDLVASALNGTTGDFSVLRGTGGGGFAPARVFTAPPRPESVAVADFNEDGRSDIVLPANKIPGEVRVFLSNADGTFTASPGSPITIPTQAGDVVTGDFNGDANADIAVATPGAVTIITGKGDGTFNAAFPQALTGGGVVREAIAAGDVNGDGRDDIIASPGAPVGPGNSPSVATMIAAASGALPSAGITSNAVPATPARPVAADFNGDGHADVVVPVGPAGAAAVLLGAADGTLGAPLTLTGPGLAPAAVGDVNHDGRADVVLAANTGAVSAFFGNGDGTFAPPVPIAGVSGGGFATALGADLDGDGFADLALGGLGAPGRVTIVRNAPSAVPTAASLAFASTVTGALSPAQTVSLTNDGQPPLRVSAVSFGGANPADFRVTADGCTGAVVAAGARCTVTVAMAPQAAGARAAELAFTSNAAQGVARVALGGTAVAPPAAAAAVAAATATQDRTAPTIRTTVGAQRLSAVLRQGLRATVACSERCTAGVSLVLSRALARRYHLPSKTAFVATSRTLRFTKSGRLPVRLHLGPRTVRALRKARSVTFTLRVVARDAAGNTRTRTSTVALKR